MGPGGVAEHGDFSDAFRNPACTAPGFLDSEEDAAVIVGALASFQQRRETAISGDTQIAAPLVKSPL